jgi:hypothetical protein
MRIKVLAIATTLGLLGVPGLANAVPAAPSPAQLDISQQGDFLLVRGGPGPWPGPPWRPGPWFGWPGGPGPYPSPWGPVPCSGPPWSPGPWPVPL